MDKKRHLILWGAALLWLLAACGGDTRHPAEQVVASYYVALNDDDSDALMDAVEPADRNVMTTGLMSLLDALSLDTWPDETGHIWGVRLGQDQQALSQPSWRQKP